MRSQTIGRLVEKSKELLQAQFEAYRSLFTKAGVLVGIPSLFLPLFLFVLEKSSPLIKVLSIIPIGVMLWGVVKMLLVMKPNQMFHGFKEDMFEELANKKLVDLDTYELGANRTSIKTNDRTLAKQNRLYNSGLTLIVFSILVSVLLLVADISVKTISGGVDMGKKPDSQDSSKTSDKPKVEIPDVPLDQLKPIQEGKAWKKGKVITEDVQPPKKEDQK